MATHHYSCAICGNQFARCKPSKYCSQKCYHEAQRRGLHNRGSSRIHKCGFCGTDVVGRTPSRKRSGARSKAIFCSRDCYDNERSAAIKARESLRCKCCSKIIDGRLLNRKRVYCSAECRKIGQKAKPKHCKNCQCLFTPITWREGRLVTVSNLYTCSQACHIEWIKSNQARKDKISKAFSGVLHPNWQGGAPMGDRGYRGHGWAAIRGKILARDGYKCKRCGITNEDHLAKCGSSLEANHIIPFWQHRGDNQRANNPSNLESLCKSCHTKTDWEYRKRCQIQTILAF